MSDPTGPPSSESTGGAFSARSEAPAPEQATSAQNQAAVRQIDAEPESANFGALVRQTHAVRGVLWGLMLGVGLAIVAVLTTTIALDLFTMIIVVVVCAVLGAAWSLFGPAKK